MQEKDETAAYQMLTKYCQETGSGRRGNIYFGHLLKLVTDTDEEPALFPQQSEYKYRRSRQKYHVTLSVEQTLKGRRHFMKDFLTSIRSAHF